MITFQMDVFPVLDVEPKPLPSVSIPTLTELATVAIYGSALLPAEFARKRECLVTSSMRVWAGHPNGPGDMLDHLRAILTGDEIPEHREAHIGRDQRENIRQWLQESRRRPAMHSLAPRYDKHKEQLMLLSDVEVVEYATEETSKLQIADAAITERASRFYSVLSSAAIAGDINLTGMMEYAYRDSFFDRPRLPYDRLDLTEKHLCDQLAHSIDENSLEANPPYETEADRLFGDIFASDRFERARSEAKIVWSDVRISLKHAQLILSRFAAAEAGGAVTRTEDVETPVSVKVGRTENVASNQSTDGVEKDRGARVGRPRVVDHIRAQDEEFKEKVPGYASMTVLARRNMIGERLMADGKVDKHPSPTSFDRAIGSKDQRRSKH